MKNLKEIGKALNREAQQNIFGGIGIGIGCYSSCIMDSHCGDPNHSCVSTVCEYDNGAVWQFLCVCTTGNA